MTLLTSLFSAENRAFLQKLCRLAVPVSIQAMMFSVLGLIDIVMVGHLGETAVAAVGLGNRIFFFNLILTSALGSGMSVLASQFIGAGDNGGLRRTLCQALLTAVLVNIPFIAAYMLVPEQIAAMASSDAGLLEFAVIYILITAPSIFCTAVVVPIEAALRASGDTKTPTWIGFYAILVNIVLNYLLIFGAFGFPEMGVAGSAWGTALSRLFHTIALILYMRKNRQFLIPTKDDARKAFKKEDLLRFFHVSWPMILQDGSWAFGVIFYNLIYARMGVNELAIMSAVSAIESILMSLFIGFGVGCSIILGQELGAKRFDQAWKQGFTVMGIAPLVALLVGLMLVLFRADIVTLFGRFDSGTLTLAEQVMLVSGMVLMIRVINFTGIIGLLRSGGDVRFTAVLNVVAAWCVGLPLTWLGAVVWNLPLYLVFLCSVSEEIVKMVMVVWRIRSRRWLRNLVSSPE